LFHLHPKITPSYIALPEIQMVGRHG